MLKPSQWFALMWRNRGGDQRAVLDEWAEVGRKRLFLQDVALRGGLYSPLVSLDPKGPAPDAIAMAVAEGRRQMALEIVKTSGLDPAELWRAIQAAQIEPARERGR